MYLFSFIGLLVAVIGTIQLVDLGLKVYVFKGADKYEYVAPKIEGEDVNVEEEKMIQERETVRQRQRQASNSIAMIVVGIPLYLYHWKKLRD